MLFAFYVGSIAQYIAQKRHRGEKKIVWMKIRRLLGQILVTAVLFGLLWTVPGAAAVTSPAEIEPYRGLPFILLNDNIPEFEIKDLVTTPYIRFSPFDSLGRTGAGMACLSGETMPTEARGSIGDIRPSGWHTVRYDDLIEDRFLYNRCHVLGYQLTGDNATSENLFTGTRYLNKDVMLYFEDRVASYLGKTPENHVIYRVTPVYEGKSLVASGVQMEAYSVEDSGDGVCFNAYLYNVQPGIEIDYSDGTSKRASNYDPVGIVSAAAAYRQLTGEGQEVLSLDSSLSGDYEDLQGGNAAALSRSTPEKGEETAAAGEGITYILNTNTKKFHYPECKSVGDMKEKNKKEFTGSREEVISRGYVPCKRCNP